MKTKAEAQKTKRERLEECMSEFTSMHSGNLGAILGIGSFFHCNLDEKISEKEKTIDLIVLVHDLDEFYEKHKFEILEFSNPEFKEKMKYINNQQMLYTHQPKSNYRLTIIPENKFKEWTSPGSPVGYFLRGRLQKPLEELMINEKIRCKVKQQLMSIRIEAVEHTFKLVHTPVTRAEFLSQLVKLSYIPEGARYYFEISLRKKHWDILGTQYNSLANIYRPLIKEYAESHGIKFDGEHYHPNTTRKQSYEFRHRLSSLKAFYTRLLINLAQAHPDPEKFYVEKALRTVRFLDNKIGSRIVKLTYPIAKKYVLMNADKNVQAI